MSTGRRLNPFEHALKRPDVYIGSVRTVEQEEWCFCTKTGTIQRRTVKYNPGLVRLFIEILSNAIDNNWRSSKQGTPMKRIEVTVNRETRSLSVWNDGAPIGTDKSQYAYTDPVTQTTTQDSLFPAQLYFGYMLAGTNYDDELERKTSGRNGMGAKAANVFSTYFEVEHASASSGRRLIFKYRNNLKDREIPILSTYRRKSSFTKVTFTPDFKYFGYPGIDDDLENILEKLTYDSAMITGLQVLFNGKIVDAGTLEKYVALYFPGKKTLKITAACGDEVVLVESGWKKEDPLSAMPQISFVNGICTPAGGVHVKAWQSALVSPFIRYFNARRGSALKASAREVFPFLFMFVRCEVTNPEFRSQTKENLTAPVPPTKKLSKREFERLMKWDFVKRLTEKLEEKAQRFQARKEGPGKRLLSFGSKADDANWAGTRKSRDCTLFITEGQSAKAFATAGISTLPRGHDKYGAFAIKGKFINATNTTSRLLFANQEVQALARILGLERDRDYCEADNFRRLRYGKVCFLTDADDDGIHIRGLLINFFSSQYPSLWVRADPFFSSMSTPVTEVTRRSGEPLHFYSTPDFLAWQDSYTGPPPPRILYIKGLGTMTAQQAKREFACPKTVTYLAEQTDSEREALKLGFDATVSGARKKWILDELARRRTSTGSPSTSQFEGGLTLSCFVNRHIIIYHCTALTRSLPSFVDGLKESQRKILFGCFLKNLKKPAKVDQLAGFISERTGYRHGGVSLQDTIVKMAQGFVGSNNIPLLQNAGQFGSRAQGGNDAAAPRYLFTAPERLTRFLFPAADDPILPRVIEDGCEVEPLYYAPVIPAVLANGARGIASGFSTLIPAFNPLDLVCWIRRWLKTGGGGEGSLTPWYRGFHGSIKKTDDCNWTSRGNLEQEKGFWHVRELPIGLWTSKFKEYLENMASVKRKSLVTSISAYNTPNTIHFKFRVAKDFFPTIDVRHNFSILQQNHSLRNMTALNKDGIPEKFRSAEEILKKFCVFRLELYEKRRSFLYRNAKKSLTKVRFQVAYLNAIFEGKISMRQPESDLALDLEKLGIAKLRGSFSYLFDLPTSCLLSSKKCTELQNKASTLSEQCKELDNVHPKTLWTQDLDAFEKAYKLFLKASARRDDC